MFQGRSGLLDGARIRRSLVLLASLSALVVAAPAAEAKTLVREANIEVEESDHDVDTNIDVKPGDDVVLSADGTIWTGYWFIGRNGPDGLWFNGEGTDYPAPAKRAQSLLGKLNGRYFGVGSGRTLTHYNYESRLALRINDNWAGNGNGAFNVHIQVYR